MPVSLPYLATPSSIKRALERIRVAATPDRVTRDFVTTKLQIKGGTGYALIPFLKKIGFVASDGSPTEVYKQFRNKSIGGAAVAKAIKQGYAPLSDANEYFFDLNDKDLLSLIVQVTGAEEDDQVAKLTLSTLKMLKNFATFDTTQLLDTNISEGSLPILNTGKQEGYPASSSRLGLNLAYTINLNLPATSDQTVFNAIFRSLKEHLLTDGE